MAAIFTKKERRSLCILGYLGNPDLALSIFWAGFIIQVSQAVIVKQGKQG